MIVDELKNAPLYAQGNSLLGKALDYIQETDFSKLKPGRHEIDGENVYAMLQEYDSRPLEGSSFEAHRRYADLHYVIEGSELLGYMHINRLTVTEPFDEEKDCEMLKGPVDCITLQSGTFAVIYPDDAHIPCLAVKEPTSVRKVVVKFRIA